MRGTLIAILAVGIFAACAAPAQEASAPPASATPSAYHADARSVLAEVLSQREFRDLNEQPSAIAKRIRSWIESFLEWLGNHAGLLPEWLRWAVWFWLIGGAVAILGHLGYWLYQSISPMVGGRVAHEANRMPSREALLGICDLDYDSVHSEALRRVHEGDWLNALRYLMTAGILRLELEGHLIRRRFKTNGSYLRELARCPGQQRAFRRLADLAEPVLYGRLPADRERCERAVEALTRITQDGTEPDTAV
jgi:hypothetical protein